MKGISPIVASVLLIAITIAIAGIVAAWTTSYTEEALPEALCVGGSVAFVSADYPLWTDTHTIRAVVEAYHVDLNDFKFAVLMNDDNVYTYDDEMGLSLASGLIGTIETDILTINPANVRGVQVLTSCPDVKTDLTPLK